MAQLTQTEIQGLVMSRALQNSFRDALPKIKQWINQVEALTSDRVLGRMFGDITAEVLKGDAGDSVAAKANADLALYDLNKLSQEIPQLAEALTEFNTTWAQIYPLLNVPTPPTSVVE
jgi:hypothetical protein